MSEKITSTFTFYGNQAVLDLEKEIIRRFKVDHDKGNDSYTSVPRILYGLDNNAKFDGYELLGAYQCWYFGSTDKFKVETATCPPAKLHDHIVEYAAKVDSQVVVQMDYIGNTPQVLGTRIACFEKASGIVSEQVQENMNFLEVCDEADIEQIMEDNGYDFEDILTFQRIDEMVEETRNFAIEIFNSRTGKDIQYKES